MKKYKCMMVVDDDDDTCFLVKCHQERMKMASLFYSFKSGHDAIEFIKKKTGDDTSVAHIFPDLILVDINMPVMNGFDFIKELNLLSIPENEKPKIFILSGSHSAKDIRRAGKLDVDGYFVKPLNKKQLDYLVA